MIFVKKSLGSKSRYFAFNPTAIRMKRWRDKIIYNTYLAQNFKPKMFVTLTYAPEYYEGQKIEAGKEFRKFMNRLKNRMRKAKMDYKFKYVRAVEHGSQKGRVHIHMVTDMKINRKLIHNAWRNGHVHAKLLRYQKMDTQTRVLTYLSKYITKELDASEHRSKLHFKWIKGQKCSTSRNFEKISERFNLYWKKIEKPQGGFFLTYELKEKPTYGWFTQFAIDNVNEPTVQSVYQFEKKANTENKEECLRDLVNILIKLNENKNSEYYSLVRKTKMSESERAKSESDASVSPYFHDNLGYVFDEKHVTKIELLSKLEPNFEITWRFINGIDYRNHNINLKYWAKQPKKDG